MAKGNAKTATKTSKASSAGKSGKAQRGNASATQAQSEKLLEYVGQAAGKERHIEASLAAHLVMTTRPAYHGRLEEYLRATKVRAEKLEGRMKELGGSTRFIPAVGGAVMGEVKDAAKMVADRAVSLAKGPLDAMRDDHEARTLLENAKVEYSDACEQIGNYTVVRALAKAADDKKTGKLAKNFRDEHADMAEFIENLIPKLATAVVKTEARGRTRTSSNGTGNSKAGAGSRTRQSRNSAVKQSSRSETSASAKARSSTTKTRNTSRGKAPSSRSTSGSGSAKSSRGTGRRQTAARGS